MTKATLNINGKDTVVHLTDDQVKQIIASSQKITDRVKTIEDALEVNGINHFEFYANCAGLTTDEIGYREAKQLTIALNEGWTPDFSNGDVKKWFIWFEYVPGSGWRFSNTHYNWTNSCAFAGLHLCFKTSELAEYAGKNFMNIYNKMLTKN